MIVQRATSPDSLQQFQQEFGQYLRNPDKDCPPHIPTRAGNTYRELVFANIRSFIDNCFPITRQLVGEETWTALISSFIRDTRSNNPLFNSIPKHFLEHLQSHDTLPEWLHELAHYEWIELAVETDAAEVRATPSSYLQQLQSPEFSGLSLQINPTLQNLQYRWAVHQISPECQAVETETFILVYRNSEHQVCFTMSNALTSALIHTLQQHHLQNLTAVCEQFAKDIQYPDAPSTLIPHIHSLLIDLAKQNILTP